ncbi:MAG: hypothetical protein Kow00105_03860 [Phycisphaeraceae bacterium]
MNGVMKHLACLLGHLIACSVCLAGFHVRPYLLDPTPGGVTVVWFSEHDQPGRLRIESQPQPKTYTSTPELASALTYHEEELPKIDRSVAMSPPYRHRVVVTGLTPGRSYTYTVQQGDEVFTDKLTAGPGPKDPIRFIVFADCETEPESTGKPANWPEPQGDPARRYVVDQTEGFRQNLKVIQSRRPGFLAFAGDITESGGEQRDWDELWRHLNGDLGSIAASVPIVAAPGNHDAYGGPGDFGRFEAEAHLRAIRKYRTYFKVNADPDDPTPDYHRLDFGPITLISLDSTNGLPDRSQRDTNWRLTARDADHDFNPGSEQYRWLESQLAEAQRRSAFTFVQFHHVPYSVGPHGYPPGDQGHDHGVDPHSGVPMRALTKLFMRYGVDAVFGGHDEMYEHSVTPDGVEVVPGSTGQTRPHSLHVFDVGIAGDGLRGPWMEDDANPYQVFLAHRDAPEVWDGKRLVSGGKHYGHMEVQVDRDEAGRWRATLTPVYVFPLMDQAGDVIGWERRIYDDVVTLYAELGEHNHEP